MTLQLPQVTLGNACLLRQKVWRPISYSQLTAYALGLLHQAGSHRELATWMLATHLKIIMGRLNELSGGSCVFAM